MKAVATSTMQNEYTESCLSVKCGYKFKLSHTKTLLPVYMHLPLPLSSQKLPKHKVLPENYTNNLI